MVIAALGLPAANNWNDFLAWFVGQSVRSMTRRTEVEQLRLMWDSGDLWRVKADVPAGVYYVVSPQSLVDGLVTGNEAVAVRIVETLNRRLPSVLDAVLAGPAPGGASSGDRLDVASGGVPYWKVDQVVESVKSTLPEFAPLGWDVDFEAGAPVVSAMSDGAGVWTTTMGRDEFRDLGALLRALVWEPWARRGYNKLHSASLVVEDQREPGYPGLDARIEFLWAEARSALDRVLHDGWTI